MDHFNTIRCAWFAIQTRYRYEHRIAQELKAKGIKSFLPAVREMHNWKDRSKAIDVPAFSGYLFAHFEPSLQNRVRVLETAGVVKLLGKPGKPEPVPDVEVDALQRMLASGMQCSRHPYVAIGTLVQIKRGALQGLEGRVIRIANALKLVINVSSICQALAVEVALEDVETIEAPVTARVDDFSTHWDVKPLSTPENYAALEANVQKNMPAAAHIVPPTTSTLSVPASQVYPVSAWSLQDA